MNETTTYINLVENGIFPITKDEFGNTINEELDTGFTTSGTIQGEGTLLGVPCIFIRTSSCNLSCAWIGEDGNGSTCDTPYCVSGDTLIAMSDGTKKPIKDIKEGDVVIGYDHKTGCLIESVVLDTKITTNNTKPTLTITTSDNKELQCTNDHNIFTVDYKKESNHKYVEASQIDIEKHRYIKLKNEISCLSADITEDKEFKKGYMIGLLEAEGYTSTSGNSVHTGIDMVEKDPLVYLNECLTTHQVNFKEYNYETRKTKTTGKKIYHTRITEKTYVEYITNLIKQTNSIDQLSLNFKRGYLSGFFDGDGGKQYSKNRSYQVIFYQREKKLLDKIYNILRSLELDQYFRFSYNKHSDCWTLKSNGGYDVDLAIYQHMYPILTRKRHSYYNKKSRTIKSHFEKKVHHTSPIDTVYDITTTTHNFFANDILIHNSSFFPEKNKISVESIINTIIENTKDNNIKHIVISGGEPFVQRKNLVVLLERLKQLNFHITVETNGLIYDEECLKYIDLMSMSPKLSSSTPWKANLHNTGVEFDEKRAQRHENKRYNIDSLRKIISYIYLHNNSSSKNKKDFHLKFVTSNILDFDEIDKFFLQPLSINHNDNLYNITSSDIMIMPEGVTPEELSKKSLWVVEECIKRGFRFTPRLHAMLFGIKRGV